MLDVYQRGRGAFNRFRGWPPIFRMRSSRRPYWSPRVGNCAPIEDGGRGFLVINNFLMDYPILWQLSPQLGLFRGLVTKVDRRLSTWWYPCNLPMVWAISTVVVVLVKQWPKSVHNVQRTALVASHALRASKHHLSIVSAIRVPCVVVLA
jgi:hypothetical protein